MGSPIDISCTLNGKPYNIQNDAFINIVGGKTTSYTVKFNIVNKSRESMRFMSYDHRYRSGKVQVTLSDQFNVCKGTCQTIQPSGSCWVKVRLDPPRDYCGIYLNLVFMFQQNNSPPLRIVRQITYDCVPDDGERRDMFDRLAPQQNQDSWDENEDEEYDDLEIVAFQGYDSHCQLEHTLDLDDYHVEQYVKQLIYSENSPGKLERIREKLNLQILNFENYSKYFNSLLDIEEIQMWKDIRHYTIRQAYLVKDRSPDKAGNTRFRVQVPGLAEKRPSVLRGDRLYVVPLPPDGYKYEGLVDDTSQNDAYLVFNQQFEEDIDDVYGMKFRIEFTLNRLSHRLMHRAVDIIRVDGLESLVFPTSFHVKYMKDPETLQLDCFEKRVEENPEQLKAVRNIVAGTSRPAPYLIYGPPGTGKTFTLVEAIKQICKTYPASKVLVCAPQNDAADLIAERLLDHVAQNSILRFNAVSRYFDSLSDRIQSISNFNRDSDRVVYPPKDILKKKQIIVSTLVTSGRLVSAEMTDHFTHIFIDEAGHATEPETVIPLGLLTQNMKSGGQVVLAGDPKQLGAIVRSTLAKDRGFGKSLLERLMLQKNGLYARDEDTENAPYNNSFVTKLLKNFRSHPQILEVPNQRFYRFELQPAASIEEREKFCGWKHLPEFTLMSWELDHIGFPLVFYQVNGREEQEMSSPSWFNRHEVLIVIDYVEKLLVGNSAPRIQPRDIGIISPYIQQVRKIRQALRSLATINEDIRDVKVGSVEKFQGDEREVIIISTVRSQTNKVAEDKKYNLGFVSNPKRFNVAVTRAKSLLIIIGNPVVLCSDENWRRLVEHIVKGGGYIGEELSPEIFRIENDEELTEAMNAICLEDDGTEIGRSRHLLHQDDEWQKNY